MSALARQLGMAGRIQVNLPAGATGVWTVSQHSMSIDIQDPTSDRTVHIDRDTGRILADIRYADYSPGAKAMAVGIAFHEGDLGIWNLVPNTAFCPSIVFLAASGGPAQPDRNAALEGRSPDRTVRRRAPDFAGPPPVPSPTIELMRV